MPFLTKIVGALVAGGPDALLARAGPLAREARAGRHPAAHTAGVAVPLDCGRDAQRVSETQTRSPDNDDARRAAVLSRQARVDMEALGPTYIKLGQMMSVRPDVLPSEVLAELATLQVRGAIARSFVI